MAHSPFVLLATSSATGACDVSPRGDTAGFAEILDDTTFLIPDRPGNRRADSLRNILENPRVGLLFLIPGMEETLRVNGRVQLIRDEHLLARMTVQGKQPFLAIAVEVEEAFLHCAKAFKRSNLWQPDRWPDRSGMPSAAQIWIDHAKVENTTVEALTCDLEESYQKTLY